MFSMVECYTEMGHIIGQDVSIDILLSSFLVPGVVVIETQHY